MSSGQRAYFRMSRYHERLVVVDTSANSRSWRLACTHHVYNSVLTLSSPRAVLHLKKHSPMWILIFTHVFTKNPGGTCKEFACQCWRCKRCRFDSGWERSPSWQSIPVFLPGESHGWRILVAYNPWGCKESETTEATSHARMFLQGIEGGPKALTIWQLLLKFSRSSFL